MDRKKEIYDLIQAARNDGLTQNDVADMLLKDYNISGSEFARMLKNKASFDKRYGEMRDKRVGLHKQDLGLIRQLGPIVGSVGNRDATFAGWASTEPSALAYLEETGKVKDGWKAQLGDVDGDGTKEVLILDKDGIVRRINGWGVKESRSPIRNDYFSNNPTIADRKNITQTEWTRGVRVDPSGKIDCMYPQAVRYTKSRQKYYDDNPTKKPIPESKQVWQQYVAKPLLTIMKNDFQDGFIQLEQLPGLASAALSQTFGSVGLLWLKAWVHMTIVGQNKLEGNISDAMSNMEAGNFYLDQYKEVRKDIAKILGRMYKNIPTYQEKLREYVIILADAIGSGNISWDNTVFAGLRQLAFNSTQHIVAYYEGQVLDNPLSGLDRIRHNYMVGRQEKKAFQKRVQERMASQGTVRENIRKRNISSLSGRNPGMKRIYDATMNEGQQAQYGFGEAYIDWQKYGGGMRFKEWLEQMKPQLDANFMN